MLRRLQEHNSETARQIAAAIVAGELSIPDQVMDQVLRQRAGLTGEVGRRLEIASDLSIFTRRPFSLLRLLPWLLGMTVPLVFTSAVLTGAIASVISSRSPAPSPEPSQSGYQTELVTEDSPWQ